MQTRGQLLQVSKWGSSPTARLPAAASEVMSLRRGNEIAILVNGERPLHVDRPITAQELLSSLRTGRDCLPGRFRSDRWEAYA